MKRPAIPAATLVLMRERGGGPPEILTVTRAKAMAFAGGAVAFPGGRIDPADEALAAEFDDPLAAFKIAALRETIEETAIIPWADRAIDPDDAHSMQALLQGHSSLTPVLHHFQHTLDLAALIPFARWKPAFHQTRMFDTLFFLARAQGESAEPLPQPGECESAAWVAAADLLERIESGTAHAIFPTKRNLERLAQFGSFAEAAAHARAHSLDTITPWVEVRGGEKHVCIPQGRGYPVTSEPLATAFRA
ncbi:NUDIX hydrolase [Sphingomonas mesophila]|uniref:NUDIX hydrolase n=1 Tax=Sphingomonas mesophila TaxID=2303576 RepID=UPI001F082575|nr:NUDIX domain-containing protein [Sphingomonas mesophila]